MKAWILTKISKISKDSIYKYNKIKFDRAKQCLPFRFPKSVAQIQDRQ